jgi:hypothetical protein
MEKKKIPLFNKKGKHNKMRARNVGTNDLLRYYKKIKKLEKENSKGDVSFP